ncbi:GNAT family N-acetyltransferase [Streptomyces sp. NPDC058308]|uniref:GNAT family N-acetyltransferase n=1 Tax=Streptomyces sp. NPDC058308 TaxID=3346440 RepID=UPI0036EB1ECC
MITGSAALAQGVLIRPLTLDDAERLAGARRRNRAHLSPWEPVRPASFYTTEGQAERIGGQLEECRAGRAAHWVLESDGEIVGHTELTNIVHGPARRGSLGYWTDAEHVGRGLASAAVRHVCAAADGEFGLHRVEACTLLDNAASQRVLAKCGFVEYGMAPGYLHINGAWRDHRLYHKILNNRPA